jgi:cell division protein FtsB
VAPQKIGPRPAAHLPQKMPSYPKFRFLFNESRELKHLIETLYGDIENQLFKTDLTDFQTGKLENQKTKMKKHITLIPSLILFIFCWTLTLHSESDPPDLQKVNAQLKAENDSLKQEIQSLRKLLATGSTSPIETKTEPKISPAKETVSPETASPETASPETASPETAVTTGFWLTTSSKKRHNNSCKYYKSSKGSECGPNDGSPCKSCGG